jgi:hypothetical protein
MKFDDVLQEYTNSHPHERKIGRYWATDIYKIRKGYLTPKKFFKQEKIKLDGCRMIETGNAMEGHLDKVFKKKDIESQSKYEIQIDDEIVLVVKPDFETKDIVIETKFPFSQKERIPEKWRDQLECEYRATKKETYLGILSVPFNLKTYKYKPSKKRWENIKEILKRFHKKLKNEETKKNKVGESKKSFVKK